LGSKNNIRRGHQQALGEALLQNPWAGLEPCRLLEVDLLLWVVVYAAGVGGEEMPSEGERSE
jgi:hypothetical protein